jgi:hypothetical protein
MHDYIIVYASAKQTVCVLICIRLWPLNARHNAPRMLEPANVVTCIITVKPRALLLMLRAARALTAKNSYVPTYPGDEGIIIPWGSLVELRGEFLAFRPGVRTSYDPSWKLDWHIISV